MPAFDGGDDCVWFCGPCEGLGLSVVFVDEAIDGGLKIVDPWGHVVGDGDGHCTARLDLGTVKRVRTQIPVAEHKVLWEGGRSTEPVGVEGKS